MIRYVFVKVGWMKFYAGPSPDDKRPIGGGGYNKTGIGHEIFNFYPADSQLFGFFQPPKNSKLNFSRIDPAASQHSDTLENVLVILVSPKRDVGQVIIGWYKNANLLRTPMIRRRGMARGYLYNVKASQEQAVLLPCKRRVVPVPQKGGLGQSGICYSFESDGTAKQNTWMHNALNYVAEYDGPNLLINPESDAEDECALTVEATLARASGQGFARTAAERHAIEDHAMNAAKRYFRSRHFEVEDVHKTKSFDLRCRKAKREVHVEVKGTTTLGTDVVLTRNEVSHASKIKNDCILFVLHSIRLVRGRAKGGKSLLRDPWRPDVARLTPITYKYQL